jgi:2,4-dienoyl-CoA reductase-like NADH-dependent reductase (Old Yellow Enzyme family)
MRGIFDETTLKGMKLNNRFVRSATWEGMCDSDGRPPEKLIRLYGDLARGGIGLIITGYSFVRPDGKQNPGKMGIHTDAFAPELTALASAVHAGGGKVCMQLVHAGGQTNTATAGRRPLAPSAVQVAQYDEVPEEMTPADISGIISAFTAAAKRAKAYGFDAIQLHGAHGYLINQFLSPLTNRRKDAYGGTIENRSRFLMEVYRAVRAAVGADFPVMIKLNGSDFLEGGLAEADAVYAARALDAEGIDAIEVSGGTRSSGTRSPARMKINSPALEGYHLPLAATIRKAVNCPLMVVGGFRSPAVAQKAIEDGVTDYIALSRPFIREPNLISRWRSGDDTPARCISCNQCFVPGLTEGGIYCVAENKERKKKAGKKTP